MKLLFDQNLSFQLCSLLEDLFPGSKQARRLGMDRTPDRLIWDFAAREGFSIVSHDSDFADMAALYGPPPKVIWLRCGNQSTETIEALLRSKAKAIARFEADPTASCLEIFAS